jgi:hypothetical protein
MGWLARLIDRIDERVDRPADQSVLTHPDDDGSERMLDAGDDDRGSASAATVNRNRNRRRARQRWLGR